MGDNEQQAEGKRPGPISAYFERVGRTTIVGIEEIGFAGTLFVEGLYWIIMGRRRAQPVRMGSIVLEMMEMGVRAIPIVAVMSGTIGIMLAIQGIHTLKIFGAESKVVLGVALSVTREFAPLITGILVAGRSGSALAARLGTMRISQEVDALRVMGINPVRYLVVPPLVAAVTMVPCLTIMADLVGIAGAGFYVWLDLGMSFPAYINNTLDALSADDVLHGLGKSLLFAILITLVGVANGATVKGGAEGVGKVTTRSVVQGISAIIVTDMIFAFLLTR